METAFLWIGLIFVWIGALIVRFSTRAFLARIDTKGFLYFGLLFMAIGLGGCALLFAIFSWNRISISLAVLFSAALAWQVHKQRESLTKLVSLSRVMHRTLGGGGRGRGRVRPLAALVIRGSGGHPSTNFVGAAARPVTNDAEGGTAAFAEATADRRSLGGGWLVPVSSRGLTWHIAI